MREALTVALARERGLIRRRRRRTDLLSPANPRDVVWEPLQKLVESMSGTVNGDRDLLWCEGIAVRLGWADDRLWLLIEPTTVFEGVKDENKAAAADFARERTVKRYNRMLNGLIDFWAGHIARDGTEIRALDVDDGIDAVFELSAITAFSRRTTS